MPKQVDHDARRQELAAAVWALVAGDGLEAVTVRRVAERSGWSTGSLAHYFADKDALLLFAFELVVERIAARVRDAAPVGDDPLAAARWLLGQGLPLDAARRAEARAWFAFTGLALTRPELAGRLRDAYRGWTASVARALAEAVERGELPAGTDAEAEATALVALVDGLAIRATLAPRALPAARQRALLDQRLDRLRGAR